MSSRIDRKTISNYQHRGRFRLLQFNYNRLLGQRSKDMLSRICECIVELGV